MINACMGLTGLFFFGYIRQFRQLVLCYILGLDAMFLQFGGLFLLCVRHMAWHEFVDLTGNLMLNYEPLIRCQ